MEEKYYNYFKLKLDVLPELRKSKSCLDNPAFDKWWGSIEVTCERMGDKYKKRADRIDFFPSVLTDGDDSIWINKRYQSGLNEAEAFIETLMEELQTWGLDTGIPNSQHASLKESLPHQDKAFNLFVTVSQQQAQQIIQTINLDDYDEGTKRQVNDLFQELNKESKDKGKIASIVKWLADKSVDALIAILLAKANLT
ncbi:MAG TPA: hypothetical protein VFZ58_04545 [Candidatus Saccharimonadales bacterium]